MNDDRHEDRCDEHDLPCRVALVASSAALMPAHAAPEATACLGTAAQQRLMARNIVSNPFFLRHHPHAPSGLRQIVDRMQDMWASLAQGEPGADGAARVPLGRKRIRAVPPAVCCLRARA